MKTIIAGSRTFTDYALLCERCCRMRITEVVSGGARGADLLGEKFAEEHDIPVKRFPAQWDKYGKSAGYKRNDLMAKYAESCVVFWDGVSKGTKHMIDLANKNSLKLHIIYLR